MSNSDSEIATVGDEMRDSSNEVEEKLAKRMKTSRSLEFKGDEKQYLLNEEKFESIEEEFTSAKPAILKIKELLEDSKKLIANHQKLILLADRSTHGWDLVKQYKVDELVEGSDDERKIRKAEKAAEKKVEKRATVRRKSAFSRGFKSRPGVNYISM